MSKAEELLLFQIKAAKLRLPVREYKFHPTRRWKFDFAYPMLRLAIEIEGGIWVGGRHNTGKGYSADCEKYNNAALLGWSILRFTTDMVKSGEALKMIESVLKDMPVICV